MLHGLLRCDSCGSCTPHSGVTSAPAKHPPAAGCPAPKVELPNAVSGWPKAGALAAPNAGELAAPKAGVEAPKVAPPPPNGDAPKAAAGGQGGMVMKQVCLCGLGLHDFSSAACM